MIAKLIFDLSIEDDKIEYEYAIKGKHYSLILSEIIEQIRRLNKHRDVPVCCSKYEDEIYAIIKASIEQYDCGIEI